MEDINILLIDDNEHTFLSIKDLIQRNQPNKHMLKLDHLTDYKQALPSLLRNTYDLFLIDEVIDGRSVMEMIQEANSRGSIKPIILLTYQESPEIFEQMSHLGVVDYLNKNTLNGSQLEHSIHYSLAHFKYLQQIKELNSELELKVAHANKNLLDAIQQVEKLSHELRWQIEGKEAAERFLQESQQLLTAIGENFPGGILAVFDQELNFIYIDGGELKALNMNKNDFTGKNLSDFLPKQQYEIFVQKLKNAFAGEQISFEYLGNAQMEYPVYDITVVPILYANKTVKQLLVVAENITERRRVEEGMQKAIAREKELNAIKSKFVSMASHEFRTPLSTIATSATLIEKYNELADEEKAKKHVYRIKSAVLTLTAIMDEFLSISRLEEGKVFLNPEHINLTTFIQEVIEQIADIAKEGQKINYMPDQTNLEITVDKQLLKNILFNLLSNAIKYSAPGKEIQVDAHMHDNRCMISVQDQGIGIPEVDQTNLFNQFFRAKNVNQIQGTGLGLTIVKRYLDLMGGSISFKSKENKGCTFTITLPAYPN